MIESIIQAPFGCVMFKNTEWDDKGKSFFMKIANESTTGWQNLQRYFQGLPPIKGKDHTELLTIDEYNVVECHSSVSGSGVRTQSFDNWRKNEGYPKVLILQRPTEFNQVEKLLCLNLIKYLRGCPYGLAEAIDAGIFNNDLESVDIDKIHERGIFCSESSALFSLLEEWAGLWPAELYDVLISLGYHLIFDGESVDL